MPLASIHLISFTQSTTLPGFLQALKLTSLKPLVISKVVRWIIKPESINVSPLLHPSKPWDILLITLDKSSLPTSLNQHIECHWHTIAGIPSRLTNGFSSKNHALLHAQPNTVPSLTGALDNPRLGATSQTLELSPTIHSWISSFSKTHTGRNAMSMLNLLAFLPEKHVSYLTYGKAFAESIGSKRGGYAKLVGNIVDESQPKGEGWDEFALAHYPSILHFADMLASEDYQSVNLKYRVPSLRDTCILCTSEIEIEEELRAEGGGEGVREKREVKL